MDMPEDGESFLSSLPVVEFGVQAQSQNSSSLRF